MYRWWNNKWHRWKAIWNEPFPDKDSVKSIIKTSFLSGLIVFLVLYIFRPFGLNALGDKLIVHLFNFGVITVLIVMTVDLSVKYILQIDRQKPSWTLGKWLVLDMVNMLAIAMGNLWYMSQQFHMQVSPYNVAFVIFVTMAVGIIPLGIFGLTRMLSKIQEYKHEASKVQLPHQTQVKHEGDSYTWQTSDQVMRNMADVMYIEAMQNYINIYYLANGKVQRDTVRSSLKMARELFQAPFIRVCHRSYLVNIGQVKEVRGNAQGLRLFLDHDGQHVVPVSRKYVEKIKLAIQADR